MWQHATTTVLMKRVYLSQCNLILQVPYSIRPCTEWSCLMVRPRTMCWVCFSSIFVFATKSDCFIALYLKPPCRCNWEPYTVIYDRAYFKQRVHSQRWSCGVHASWPISARYVVLLSCFLTNLRKVCCLSIFLPDQSAQGMLSYFLASWPISARYVVLLSRFLSNQRKVYRYIFILIL